MTVTVKACHLCMNDVRAKLDRMRLPYTTSGNKLYVNITSPSNWAPTSLAAMCWRGLEFSYHAAVRKGNVIACSRAA